MPITWADIPREILEIILNKLKRLHCYSDYDLRECSLVCHGWSSAAQAILLSKVHLKSEDDVEKIIYTVARKPSLVGFVKTLHYLCYKRAPYAYYFGNNENVAHQCDEIPPYRHITLLATLANLFPTLEKIHSTRFDKDSFYELFCNLVKDGKFSSLKEFPDSRNKHQDELRASCLLSHGKNNITKLNLTRDDDNDRNDYQLVCGELSQFSRLDELVIAIYSRTPQSIIQYIESLTLVTAKKLDFTADFPVTFNLSAQDLKDIQPMLQVKKFSTMLWRRLDTEYYTDFIFYLIEKLPNLEDLKLSFVDHWRINLTERDSAKLTSTPVLLYRFFKYLSKMSKYSFKYCSIDANNLVYLIKQYLLIIDSQKNDQVHFNLERRLDSSEPQPVPYVYVGLGRDREKKIIDISLWLHPQDYDNISSGLLQSLGQSVDTMTINTNRTLDIMGLFRISRSCPNLKSLEITGNISVGSTSISRTSYQGHSQLRELILQDNFKSEMFQFIPQEFPGLESLKITNYHSCEIHGSAVPRIITRLDMFNFSVRHFTLGVKIDGFSMASIARHLLYLKIITQLDEKTRYYQILATNPTEERLRTGQAKNSSKEEYRNTIGDEYCLHYEIECKSLEKITVSLSTIISQAFITDFYLK